MGNNSVIDDYIASFDTKQAGKRLIQKITADFPKDKSQQEYYPRLSEYTGISIERLKELFSSEAPLLYRDEVKVLGVASATCLCELFGLPDLSLDETVKKEFKSYINGPGKDVEIGLPGEVKTIEVMRALLYMHSIRSCLNKFYEKE